MHPSINLTIYLSIPYGQWICNLLSSRFSRYAEKFILILFFQLFLTTAAAALLLSACGTTAPTQFYLLNPIPDGASPAASNRQLSIALSPVQMPEHLKRSQIVTRNNGHQVSVDEFNRWAEPPKSGGHDRKAISDRLGLALKSNPNPDPGSPWPDPPEPEYDRERRRD